MRWLAYGVVAGVLGLAGPAAMACSCMLPGGTPRQVMTRELRVSDFVAEIEVVSTATIRDPEEIDGEQFPGRARLQAEINVLKKWKGADGVLSVSSTGNHGGGCGYWLQPGQRLMLFAYVNKATGHLLTDTCTLTKPLEDAGEDIELLKDLTAEPKPAVQRPKPVPLRAFTQSDFPGVWSATAPDGTIITMEFLKTGEMSWFVDERDIRHPDSLPVISARYRVRQGEKFWELDLYDIVGADEKDLEFFAIFKPASNQKLRMEGNASNDGGRPEEFGEQALEFVKASP